MTNPFKSREVRKNTAIVAFALAIFLALIILGGLFTLFAWNIGVVALVAALGGEVGTINLLAAIGINFALTVIGGIFRRPTTGTPKKP